MILHSEAVPKSRLISSSNLTDPEAPITRAAVLVPAVIAENAGPLEACRFVDEVGSSAVGIYIDVANMVLYGYPEMWIHDLGERITKVHVKDFRRRDNAWVQLMDGDVNWPAVMNELRNIGFDGALVSEVGGDEKMVRETVERIKRICEL